MRSLVVLITLVLVTSACWFFYQQAQNSNLDQAAQKMVDDFEKAAEEVARDRER